MQSSFINAKEQCGFWLNNIVLTFLLFLNKKKNPFKELFTIEKHELPGTLLG